MTNEQYYIYIKESIHVAAEEALGKYERLKRQKPYWWDRKIEDLIKNKREKYNKYLNTKAIQDKIKYKKVQTKVRKTKKK